MDTLEYKAQHPYVSPQTERRNVENLECILRTAAHFTKEAILNPIETAQAREGRMADGAACSLQHAKHMCFIQLNKLWR